MKNNGNLQKTRQPRVVGVTLYPGDQTALEKIKKQHGLLNDTDAIRMAIRQFEKLAEKQPA